MAPSRSSNIRALPGQPASLTRLRMLPRDATVRPASDLTVDLEDLLTPPPSGPLVIAPQPHDGVPIRLSVVVPTYNESRNIEELLRQISAALDIELGSDYEIIVVDDDSPDRTWAVAAALSTTYPRLRVVRRSGERGLATAVVRGWQIARGDVLAVIDGDLQHPPGVLSRLWRAVDLGADLAVASRNVEGGGVSNWSLARRILSRGAQFLGLMVLPGVLGRLRDPMSGYFMIRRSAIANVVFSPLGYKILVEVVGRGRVRSIEEVGYVFRERSDGASKVTWRIYLDYFRHLLRLRIATLPSRRFARFVTVGATGALVDMAVLFLLSDPRTLALGLTRSKLAAAEIALVSNFLLNDIWTFRDLTLGQRGWRHKLRRFAKFNVICGVGLVLSIVLLNLQFNLLGMNRYLSNAIAIALMTAWNYRFNLILGWRDTAER